MQFEPKKDLHKMDPGISPECICGKCTLTCSGGCFGPCTSSCGGICSSGCGSACHGGGVCKNISG